MIGGAGQALRGPTPFEFWATTLWDVFTSTHMCPVRRLEHGRLSEQLPSVLGASNVPRWPFVARMWTMFGSIGEARPGRASLWNSQASSKSCQFSNFLSIRQSRTSLHLEYCKRSFSRRSVCPPASLSERMVLSDRPSGLIFLPARFTSQLVVPSPSLANIGPRPLVSGPHMASIGGQMAEANRRGFEVDPTLVCIDQIRPTSATWPTSGQLRPQTTQLTLDLSKNSDAIRKSMLKDTIIPQHEKQPTRTSVRVGYFVRVDC